jgi:hypothetical protein
LHTKVTFLPSSIATKYGLASINVLLFCALMWTWI